MTLHETLEPRFAAATGATFHDLMAGVGYLLFQWSLLEASLDEEIALLRRASGDTIGMAGRARTVNERLAEWRALHGRGRRRRADDLVALQSVAERVQDYQRLHHLVATGLIAASNDAEPAIRCAHPHARHGTAEEVRMTVRDILEAVDAMERCRTEMVLLRGLGEA